MASVDELIDAIDNRDELTAQKLLEQQPTLATGESLRDGVLQGATTTALGSPQEYDQPV